MIGKKHKYEYFAFFATKMNIQTWILSLLCHQL